MGDTNEFVDNGNAPEFFANGLHDVEVMGPVSRFILFVVRRTPRGVLYREPALTCVMPTEAVGPGIEMMCAKLGAAVIIPADASAAVARVRRRLAH